MSNYSKMRSVTNFVNVNEDPFAAYELALKNGWIGDDVDFDDFVDDGGELAMFEGDPDMIKYDGHTGYFALCGDTVYYYWPDGCTDKIVRGILRDFYANGEQVHAGYYDYFWPKKTLSGGSWDGWDAMNRGIAYRGGCGYFYNFLSLR